MVRLDRVKELCKKNGLKQKELFALVGKPEWYGGDIKKGVTVPIKSLNVWAEALHTTPEYLTGETDEPGQKEKPAGKADGLQEFTAAYNRLNDQKRRMVLYYMKLLELDPDLNEVPAQAHGADFQP